LPIGCREWIVADASTFRGAFATDSLQMARQATTSTIISF
jgi:hypothetical protein